MKLVKSFALGTAAALVTMAGAANAADLPGAEPVEYVRVCDAYGAGFFYIPGTETCLQIGGFARLEITSGERLADDNNANRTGYRVRTRVWFDARTDTEYGAVRTFVRLQFQRETGAAGQTGQASPSNGDDFLFDQAYVQFAGLTAGVTDSFWDFKPYATFQNPFISDRTLPVIAYTAKFGDFSASIALEDKSYRFREGDGSAGSAPIGGIAGGNAARNAGQALPDIVANLRVKQGWGEAQLSGVLSRINPRTNYRGTALDGVGPGGFATGDNEWGWGVQAGVKLNLPTANTSDNKGDYLWAQAAYTDGAGLSYNGIGDANIGSGRTENIVGYNPSLDYLLINGDTKSTQAFSANIGALHYWSPKWRSSLQGSYISVDYARANADWSAGTITGNLIWTPVKKLDIGAEVVYVKNLKESAFTTRPVRDDDAFVGRLRVQRDF